MNKETIINFFKPSYHRTLLTIFSLLIYNNTYSNTSVHILSGGIIAPLLFPSFYLAYMYIYYPENFNYKNKNPTIPDTGLINEMNKLSNSPYKTIFLFLILYIFSNYLLYGDKIKKFKFKDVK